MTKTIGMYADEAAIWKNLHIPLYNIVKIFDMSINLYVPSPLTNKGNHLDLSR